MISVVRSILDIISSLTGSSGASGAVGAQEILPPISPEQIEYQKRIKIITILERNGLNQREAMTAVDYIFTNNLNTFDKLREYLPNAN